MHFPGCTIGLTLLVVAVSAVSKLQAPPLLVDKDIRECRKLRNSYGNLLCSRKSFVEMCPCTCDELCFEQQERLQGCCRENGVKEACMNQCRYYAEFRDIVCLGHLCANDLDPWTTCAANKRTFNTCCHSRGVPAVCDGFCSGQAPSDIWTNSLTYAPCLARVADIIDCARTSQGQPEDPDFHSYIRPPQPVNPETARLAKAFCNQTAPAKDAAGAHR